MTAKQVAHDQVDIRRSHQRFHTGISWLDSHHSFSFSNHYDPHNTHHGLLLVSNDDVVQPNTGFRTHPHQDMEIVTWVLDGELEHKDSEGNSGIIYPGLAQRMSASTGIWHSEMNPQTEKNVHFIQMWVPPDTDRINPSYEQLDINRELDRGGLIPVASGVGMSPRSPSSSRASYSGAGDSGLGNRCRFPMRCLCISSLQGGARQGAGALQTNRDLQMN
jgi:hypothetical protein